MANKPLYTAVATSHGGRDGRVKSSDGILDLDVKTPKELGGPGSVELHASLPGVARAEAEALVQAAHQVCPYSVATRGNIEVKLVVD